MKKGLAAIALALLLPACALAERIELTELADAASGSSLAVFSVAEEQNETGKAAAPSEAALAINGQIEARFAQQKAQAAMNRGAVVQQGRLWQDEKTASMALLWKGEQADSSDGCTALALNVNLETGEEIRMEQLFADWNGALERMETIIEQDVLENMSDYMEYSDLLPMPTDSFSFDEQGLTVYWPEDRYRYFDGTSGAVTFYWHELASCIGEESPVYALAHPTVEENALQALCGSGSVSAQPSLKLGELLGEIRYALADPDYTTDALVYPLERERGYAVEIPKYAETEEEKTPVSAIRASRVSMGGLLTTGQTAEAEVVALLGQPVQEQVLDEDAAFDALLEPGKSLYYTLEERALQLHFDENGMLSCVILRTAMPEN